MKKFQWHQPYILERFDLTGPQGLIGWIVGYPNQPLIIRAQRNYLGWIQKFQTTPEKNEKELLWQWKIFWIEKDEQSQTKNNPETDNQIYNTMEEAKEALQNIFSIPQDDTQTIINERSGSGYK